MKNKLYLFDAMALIYRSFYALNKNPRINSKGLNTSAVLGFVNTLYDLIKKQNPTHVGVAFDLQAPTFRHEKCETYKANRDRMPEEIQLSIPIIKELLQAMNIPILACEGYEADDVIGTIAQKAEKKGYEVFMVTPDKDFAQLITENIFMYRLGRMGNPDQIWKVEDVLERFGIKRPDQVRDILGLWGDSSDNIPGIPGVGEKKAKLLVEEFDSVENLIKNVDKVSNEKLKNLIKENAEGALFSKELATIIVDVPLEFDEQQLEKKTPNVEVLKPLLEELEFRTFAKRLFTDLSLQEEFPVATPAKEQRKSSDQMSLFDSNEPETIFANQSSFDEKTVDYKVVETDEEINNLIDLLNQQEEFAFSTLFDEKSKEIKGLSFSFHVEQGYYVPCLQNAEKNLDKFKDIFENKHIKKITFDLKAEKSKLIQYGIRLSAPVFDILLAHYLLEPEMRHKLDILSETYLKYVLLDETTIIGKQTKSQHANYEMLDKTLLKNCITEKADICLQLQPVLENKLEEKGLIDLFSEIEMPLVEVLFQMEQEGVKIDKEYLQQYSNELQEQKKEIETRIYAQAEEVFNIGSPKQLGDILFSKLKIIDNPPKTATKQFSTSEDVLIKLKDKHPIVQDVLEYRSLSKLISTYLEAFPTLISEKTNRIHTSFNQAVTATGRLSSNNPNLQNIPIRTERGREIRKAFVPRNEDYLIMSADYSQVELRIIASLAQDKHMMDAFENNIDIHTSTASRIFNVPIEEVTKDMRRKAKSVNFGIIYGISAFGLSEQLQIPRKEASDLIKEYFAQYPDIESYIKSNIEFAKQNGYVKTMKGRRRYLPEINSRNMNLRSFAERNAVNMPIQGSAADMIKIAMIKVYDEFTAKGLKSKMILQVHDELVFDVHKTEIEIAKEIVHKEMQNALFLSIPVEVEIGIGENWLEAH